MSHLAIARSAPARVARPETLPDVRDRADARDRTRIDGLAIGAPVTAAFIGVMLANGELAGAGSAGADASATAASGLELREVGASAAVPGEAAPTGAEQQAEIEDGAAGPATALDPVSVGAPPAQSAEAPPSSEPVAPASASAAAPVGGPDAVAGGAITVNLSSAAAGLAAGPGVGGAAGDDLAPLGARAAGASGDDILQGTDQSDHLEGGAGNDLIYGLGGNDWLDGGPGDDGLFGGDGADRLQGGSGADLLDGGADNDVLDGGSGADRLFGGSGSDQLDGGADNDVLDGGSGADRLAGGAGDDVLIVDDRSDLTSERSYGSDGGGHDVLQVEDGFDSSPVTFVFGNDGATGAAVSSAWQQVDVDIEDLILNGSIGHDAIGDARDNSLVGNAGDNALYGGAGDDVLQGRDGADLLDGGLGMDRLEGGAGNDILTGGFDADDLYGGDGDDRLAGGAGADHLYGAAGDDTYVIGLNDTAVDTLFDHEGSNQIVLEGVGERAVEARLLDGDLYLVADDNPVAVVSDYVGHEDSFAGVDLGAGLLAIEDLLAGSVETTSLEPTGLGVAEPSGDLLASYLSQPSLIGADTSDHLVGTDGADWLSGLVGNDELQGGAGADVLEGGAGSDLLQGGADNDHYLFKSGESGLDTIRDAEGSNIAELHGFTGARLEGVVVGQDLFVVADHAPVFKVEGYVGHEDSFAGVQVDDTFVPTDELFS